MAEILTRESLKHYEDAYARRIEEFTERLPIAAIVSFRPEVDLSEDNPAQEASRAFIAKHSIHAPALYMIPEVAKDMHEGLIGFSPLVSSGHKSSKNGVFFGMFHFEDGSDMEVAVKPFDSPDDDIMSRRQAETACLKDFFLNVAAEKAHMHSLTPLGFMLGEDGRQYSITALEDLTTFDSIDWKPFFNSDFENSGMKDMWEKAAAQVAIFHNTGRSFHGDLYARNIADNPDGQVFLIDLELGNVSLKPPIDTEERFGASWVDLKALIQSMAKPTTTDQPGIDMFAECEGSWWEAFREVFFDTYVDWRCAFVKQGSHHSIRLRETESELQQLSHSLQMQMDQMQAYFQRQK